MSNPWGNSFGVCGSSQTVFIESFDIQENTEMVQITLSTEENSIILNDDLLVIYEDVVDLIIEEDENE